MSLTFNSSVVDFLFWTDFKTLAINSKLLSVQYEVDTATDHQKYVIFAIDGPITYLCYIWTVLVPTDILTQYSQTQNDTDRTDFLTNYQPNANNSILNHTVSPGLSNKSSAAISFGDVVLASVTTAAVRRTAYTEQTTNFQGSIVSASANDAAAGTGAQTVTITYLDQTGAGPFTETVTLNGITAVNLVNTNHAFIENIAVTTVGSGASNAGIITLKTGTGGTGTTVGTINAGDNRTFWAHHYVPLSKTSYLTSMSGTVTGGPGSFFIKTIPLNTSNAVENQITDTIRVTSQSPTTPRNYGTPLRIVGPARILAYTISETTSALTYRLSFDYYDQQSVII